MVEQGALHLVWDWNGTVLNDFDVSFRSTNSSFRDAGLPEITTATYRALLRSPIRSFYTAVLHRDPSNEECDFLDRTFTRTTGSTRRRPRRRRGCRTFSANGTALGTHNRCCRCSHTASWSLPLSGTD
jgi:phosphoglycolate phosphatase-like HAD superfamily hydrolase